MMQDEIIRMAREAGFTDIEAKALEYFYQAAFTAGVAHEREACAKMCEEIGGSIYVSGRSQGADFCAAAIRARGNV